MAQDSTVLVVDDEPMIRMLAADMLDVLGWSVVEAGGVGEALSLAGDGASFRAALIDLGLPDRPGEELVEEIRRLRPDLPIIVTTGRDESSIDGKLREAGVAFVGKPYQLSDLEAALESLNLYS
jgi:CheY-like chemotaxis protein